MSTAASTVSDSVSEVSDSERDVTDSERDVSDSERDVSDSERGVTDSERDVSDSVSEVSESESEKSVEVSFKMGPEDMHEILKYSQLLDDLKGDEPYYYEVIKDECLPYFDIEVGFTTAEELQQFIERCEQTMFTTLKNRYAVTEDNKFISFASAHGKSAKGYKFSIHAIFHGHGYHVDGTDVKLRYEEEINELLHSVDSRLKIDNSVYKDAGKRQLFRTILSTKEPSKDAGNKRILIPLNAYTFKPLTIEQLENDLELMREYFCTNIDYEDRCFPVPRPKKVDRNQRLQIERRAKPRKEPPQNVQDCSLDDIYEALSAPEVKRQIMGYKQWTLEEATLAVNALETKQFGERDAWRNLVWSVRSGCDEMGWDEDATLEMLDKFCEQCPGWDKYCVAKMWMQYKEKANGRSWGSVVDLLKKNNIDVYNQIMRPIVAVKEECKKIVQEVKPFDRDDPYTFYDFMEQYKCKEFRTKAEMMESVVKNVNRVIAHMFDQGGYYLIKQNCAEGLFTTFKKPEDNMNFSINYADKKIIRGKEVEVKKSIKFTELIHINMQLVRTYRETCWIPGNEDPKRFNLWQSFQAKRVESVDMRVVQPVLDVLQLWANHSQESYKYILSWIANTFRKPAELNGRALVLISKQGAMKTTIFNLLQRMSGTWSASSFQDIGEAASSYNGAIRYQKLIMFNELGSSREEFRHNYNKIKPLITDRRIRTSNKYERSVEHDNFANIMMFTQHRDAIHIETSDRRYNVFEVSDELCGDENKDKNERLAKQIDSQNTANHFYTYLLDLPESELMNVRSEIKTKVRQEAIMLSMTAAQRFVTERINEALESKDDARLKVPVQQFYDAYRRWCSDNGEHVKSNRKFASELLTINVVKTHTNKGWFYKLPKTSVIPLEQLDEEEGEEEGDNHIENNDEDDDPKKAFQEGVKQFMGALLN